MPATLWVMAISLPWVMAISLPRVMAISLPWVMVFDLPTSAADDGLLTSLLSPSLRSFDLAGGL